VIIILLIIRPGPVELSSAKSSALKDLKEGFQFALRSDPLRTLILSSALFVFFGFSFVTLIPAWAVDVLGGDVRTNGLLLSARGGGALIGALMLAAMSHSKIRGKLWTAGSFVLPLSMFAFSMVRSLPLSLISMGILGWGLFSVFNVTNTLIQTTVPDRLRGRIMGIYTQVFQVSMPLGSLILAWTADQTNPPIVVMGCSIAILVLSIFMFFWKPSLRTQD
jgi:predicted MFS family arabinose efflux permease